MVVEEIGLADERSSVRGHLDGRVSQEIRRPRPIQRPGRDKNRAVGLADEPDRDLTPFAGLPAACAEASEPRVVGERRIEVGDALGAASRPVPRRAGRPVSLGVRQRPRCQDLPSVATDGA